MITEDLKDLRKKYVGKVIDTEKLIEALEYYDVEVNEDSSECLEVQIMNDFRYHTYRLDLIDGKVIAKIHPDYAEHEISSDAARCRLVRCSPSYYYLEKALEESVINDAKISFKQKAKLDKILESSDDDEDEDDE